MTTDLIEYQKLTSIIKNYEKVQADVKEGFELLATAKERLEALFGDYHDNIIRERISDRDLRGAAEDSAKFIRRQAWEYLIDQLQLRTIMSDAAKKHLGKQIEENRLPEITFSNVNETFMQFMKNADGFFQEAIKEVFNFLIPGSFGAKYKTNQRHTIGAKVIIPFAVEWSRRIQHHKEQQFYALDNVFHRFDGKGTPKYPHDLVTTVSAAIHERKSEAETPYFRCRWYRNGNLHLAFLRPDLLRELNRRGGDHQHVSGPKDGC